MKRPRVLRVAVLLLAGFGLAGACGFNSSLREYLDAHFWLPFARLAVSLERPNVRRANAAFAGMTDAGTKTPLEKLRAAYQAIPVAGPFDDSPTVPAAAPLAAAIAAAKADASLTADDREEIDLIDAKIDMRLGELEARDEQDLKSAEKKLIAFLRTAKIPEYRSEARGWLAHVYYLTGDQTAAGRIYLDELNRDGSNLSRETILDSLHLTYGYDGGPQLIEHLEDYFDTPERATFAIQLVTNPHWRDGEEKRPDEDAKTYARIKALFEKHAALLKSVDGSNALALLGMRTAVRMGDPPSALAIASMVPANAPIRSEPDFNWMLASAHFLTHDFAGAEAPLLEQFRSRRSSDDQKAAAAYGLCGVYMKTGNAVEQIRFALWLHHRPAVPGSALPANTEDLSIYWAPSGWDLATLLDTEASDQALESFIGMYSHQPGLWLVQYALAVRRARENRYDEAARIYQSISAAWRISRMQQLAGLYKEANRTDLTALQLQEAKYKLAELISKNEDRIYFNDQLWSGLQRYALSADTDDRLTGKERDTLTAGERKLKDDQEGYWRAYLILKDVVLDSGNTESGRRAARLAIQDLRRISDRFGRQDEIRNADIELSKWLRNPPA